MYIERIILTVVYFFAAKYYHLFGIYVLKLNHKAEVNKVYFVMSISLSIWGFSFALANHVDSSSTSIFLHQLAVFGWGTFYSLCYHFFKCIEEPEVKRGKKFYALVYIPAIINIILQLGFKDMLGGGYEMQLSKWGWVYTSGMSFDEIFFNFYFVIFGFLSFLSAYRCTKKQNDKKIKNLFLIVFIACLFMLTLGMVTDVLIARIQQRPSPQLSVIWLFIPMITMFYMIYKHRIMHPKIKKRGVLILDDHDIFKIFDVLGFSYIFISFILFFILYFSRYIIIESQLWMSLYLYVLGVVHFFVYRIIKNKRRRNIFLSLSASLTMIMFSIFFTRDGVMTTWSIFFVFIIVTAVLEKQIYGIIIAFSFVLSQLVFWYCIPKVDNVLDWYDYVVRIYIIIMVSLVIKVINTLYRQKINENSNQILIQETLTDLSQMFIDVNRENKDNKIMELLDVCNEKLGYSRSYLCSFDESNSEYFLRYLCEDGVCTLENSTYEIMETENGICTSQWVKNKIKNKESVIINDLDLMPKNDEKIKKTLIERNIGGFSAFPVIHDGKVSGALIFELGEFENVEIYPEYNQIVANLIGDAMEKVAFEEELFKNAHYDYITGFYNRAYFTEKLDEVLNSFQYNRKHAIIFFDIDNFKSINDVFGHTIGDEVLVEISRILTKNIDRGYFLSRFGGDEFVVACPGISNEKEIEKFVQSFLKIFESPISIKDYEFRVSLNAGISIFPRDGFDADSLLKNADLAMYESRKLGKNTYHFCNEQSKVRIVENFAYTNKLFDALRNDEFLLSFQPQFNLKTGKMTGAEALLRWNSPDFGFVPPHKFIPILEHTGLIIDVGEWAIRQTVAQHVRLLDLGLSPIRISVNLSAVQFLDKNLVSKIQKIIEDSGINPKYLEFEITESVAVSEHTNFISTLKEIKNLGCHIAIDDFGVEFSSLNRLQSLPVDRLKIDKSFVDGIGKDERKESVLNTIILLSKTLHLESIAEGVENEDEIKFLLEQGCEEAQGYFYSKPLFKNDYENFAKRNN